MRELRFAVLGAGFWSHYQLAAWREVKGACCVAIFNRTRAKAEALAQKFGVPAVYDDAENLFRSEQLDFVDVVTDVETHSHFVHLAAKHKVAVICQKPMAPSLKEAEKMVATCKKAGVWFGIHENWRWQTPLHELKKVLASGAIGSPFRARIDMISGFPVFVNQPFLKELRQFILTDLGSHILDVARFLFGEAESLYCQTRQVHANIKGEDVATAMMRMGQKTSVVVEMAYAENYLEHDRFPETYAFIEGDKGSVELGPDFWIRVTTKSGTQAQRHSPPRYEWANPAYDVVHASIVPCHADLLHALRRGQPAQTSAEDNLKTVRLVFAAYESAAKNQVVRIVN
jgi:D-apiose dehydrogenase